MDELEQEVMKRLAARGIDTTQVDAEALKGFTNNIRTNMSQQRLQGQLQPGQQERLTRLGIWPDGKQRPHAEKEGSFMCGGLPALKQAGEGLVAQTMMPTLGVPATLAKMAGVNLGPAEGAALPNDFSAITTPSKTTAEAVHGALNPSSLTAPQAGDLAVRFAAQAPTLLGAGRGIEGLARGKSVETPQARAAKLIGDLRPGEGGRALSPDETIARDIARRGNQGDPLNEPIAQRQAREFTSRSTAGLTIEQQLPSLN